MRESIPAEVGKVIADFETKVAPKVEAKVKAASTAAAVAGVIISLLAAFVFKTGVPEYVQAIIGAAVTGGLTFVAGWLARHTPRAGDAPSKPLTPPAPPAPPVPPTA